MAEVSPLSGRVSPRCRGPIRPITGRPSLAPPLLYPLRHPLPCSRDTAASQRRDEWGLPLLSNGEMWMGRLRPIVRRVMVPPSSRVPIDDPTRVPFLAPAYQHLWPVLD